MSSRYGGQGRKNVHAYRKGSFKAGVYGYALDAVVYQDDNGKWRYAHNDKLAPTDLVTRIHRYENKPPTGGLVEPYTVIDKQGKAHTYGVISPDAAHAGSLIFLNKAAGKLPSQADLVKDLQNPTRHQTQEIPIGDTKKKFTKILRTPEKQAALEQRDKERATRPPKTKSPEQLARKLQKEVRERQDQIIEEHRSHLPKSFGDQQDIKPTGGTKSDASPGTMPTHERAKTKLTVTPDGKMSVTLTPESPSVRHHAHEMEFERGATAKQERREELAQIRQEIKHGQQVVNLERARRNNAQSKAIREEFLLNKQKGNVPKGLTLQEYQAIHYGSPLPKGYTVSDAYIKETTRTTRLEMIKQRHQQYEAQRLKDESLYRDKVFEDAGVKKRHQPKLGETLGDERSKARRNLAGEVLRQETYTKHATWDAEHQTNPREYKKIIVTKDKATGKTYTSTQKESDQYRFGHAAHNRAINSIKSRIEKIQDADTRAILMEKLNLFEYQTPSKSAYHDILTDIKRIRSYEKRMKKKK